MANINSYSVDSTIDPLDKLIGSDGSTGPDNGKTKNFTVSSLKDFVLSAPKLSSILEAADDAAAAALSVPVGGIYRTGSVLKIRVA